MHRARMLLPVLMFSISVCAGTEEPGRTVEVDTLEDGVIHAFNRAAPEAAPVRWRGEVELRIGRMEGGGPGVFGRIADLLVDSLGRIYVLDGHAHEVRVFTVSGAHVRTFGREGGGPGEFRHPVGLAWLPESRLLVVDPGNSRYAIFDTTGTFLGSHPRPSVVSVSPWPGGVDVAGRIYDVGLQRDGRSGERVNFLYRTDADFTPTDTLPLPPDVSEYFEIRQGNRSFRVGVPFAPRTIWALDVRRAAIWTGRTDQYGVRMIAFDGGRTLRRITQACKPRPVSSAAVENALDDLDEFIRRGGTIDRSRIPETLPVFNGLLVDHAGRVWIAPSAEGTDGRDEYHVFAAEGHLLGRAQLPKGFSVRRFVRDAVYGTMMDDYGTPAVARVRLDGVE